MALKSFWLMALSTNRPWGSVFQPKSPSHGYLYQIRFVVPGVGPVWKIGITQHNNTKDRVYGMGMSKGVTYTIHKVRKFPTFPEARSEEKRLHLVGLYQGMKYDGPKFLKNGHTELFLAPMM
ncbi:hypothetical protein PTKU15_11940 [Paraburkholderia terrae]|nr:hypothetical protein PTKU15_11940 [Paraburkholderia terrae]